MYFQKLDLSLPNLNYQEHISHYLISYGKKKLLTYYRLNEYASNQVLNVIPQPLREHVCSVDYVISGTEQADIVPHIDNGIQAGINFYITTANACTLFYEAKSPGIPTPITDPNAAYGNIGGKVFSLGDVIFKTGFKAKDNDCYLLNVSKPHSVFGLAVPNQRKFVTVMFDKIDFLSISKHFT